MIEEKLFENKTNFNKSILREGFKIYWKQPRIKKIKIICIFVIVFITLLLSMELSTIKNIYSIVPYAFVLGAYTFLFISLIMYPRNMTKNIIKTQKYTFELERTIDVYCDRLEINTIQSKLIIPFYMIDSGKETKDTFFMIFENQIICISKSGFTIGSPSEFGKFIRTKINIK